MINKIIGTVVKVLPLQTGEGKNGTWYKRDFVLETLDQYPKKVCLSTWGEDITETVGGLRENQKVTVSFNLESREYKEKWFTEARAWKIEHEQGKPNPEKEKTSQVKEESDDLPF